MPEAYLLDEHGQVLKTLVSNNLPLGAAANQDFTGTASRHDASEAASLFAYSDGVVEQSNNEGEMFGYDRLRHALCKAADGMRRVDAVFNDLRAFQRQHPQFDDISMFELHFSRARNALISSALQEQILC
jgi:serine phosphatase RsbU (regulator of sigma subunit)